MREPELPSDDLVELLWERVLEIVQQKGRDLSLRQLAVLLVCCSIDEPQTVRGLAQYLQIQKPSITRAVDRLEQAGLAKRQVDHKDRRSVLITATPAGRRYYVKFFGPIRKVTSEGSGEGVR